MNYLDNDVSAGNPQPATRAGAKVINLALQGGGSHGAFTWGVLDRMLEEPDLRLEGITASSAGAVNAVALAYGLTVGGREEARGTLRRFWRRISEATSAFAHSSASETLHVFCQIPAKDTPTDIRRFLKWVMSRS